MVRMFLINKPNTNKHDNHSHAEMFATIVATRNTAAACTADHSCAKVTIIKDEDTKDGIVTIRLYNYTQTSCKNKRFSIENSFLKKFITARYPS